MWPADLWASLIVVRSERQPFEDERVDSASPQNGSTPFHMVFTYSPVAGPENPPRMTPAKDPAPWLPENPGQREPMNQG